MVSYSIIQKSQLEGALRLDAEYYQQEYLDLIKNLNNLEAVPIENVAINPQRKFKPQKGKTFQYIEISEVDLSTGEYNKTEISGENAPDRAQQIIKKDDVIVSTVRPIRNAVSLIGEDAQNLVCSSGFTVLKSEKIEPEYLFIYLKTKPIIAFLDRSTTATMYPAITADDILNTKIYLGDKNFREEIKNNVVESKNELDNSQDLYFQAENLLLEELGLKDFKNEENLFNIINLSEVKNARRIDAEYFQNKYDKITSLIRAKKGIEPGAEEYQEEGKLFIRVSSLSKQGITDKDQKYLSDKLYLELKKDFEPKTGEILLTKDATPGIAYVLKEPLEGIVSGGVLCLKIKEDIDAEYLALCINSIVGQTQAERDAGGSIIAHWKPEQIKNILIPILPKSIQQKIADLVRKSHEARKKAKELLEQAKQKVEKLIEK
ncbi:MAG: dna methylase-type i restriction-modification system [Candidatus Azambacteria bacterium GW2011_GWE1_42_9]|nr:MAG: dna methylase-type i restriction-modification system [Candidatus Azambacteria bacterium GW2011_GWF1_41_10]KKS49085.1 MAG: dna methylase-type i restriction-modification system [Candidatus Azambacteria bacterium GW2011_GWF2_42_22]KKS69764.1 MAG: dna methylase-type i restriction-modification system [Candidatus Azambacteria bacterium GW2011_GWA2_42_62]KKS74397.1 MAG: dna methylase-type i restriction-modification system [Candidatus Azambacteria bacterium GW2011_GWB1_42_72]KKS79418.1 MAG: dna